MSVESDKVGRGREREQVKRSTKRVMDKMDQEARDAANAALALSDAHERLCTERWATQVRAMARVELTMTEVNSAIHHKIGKAPAGLIAGLTAIIGFLAARVLPTH